MRTCRAQDSLLPGQWVAEHVNAAPYYDVLRGMDNLTGLPTPLVTWMMACPAANRTEWRWQPSHCKLHSLDREAHDACKTILRGQHLLFVGDSTTLQQYFAFVLRVGGVFAPSIGDEFWHFTASACANRTRTRTRDLKSPLNVCKSN